MTPVWGALRQDWQMTAEAKARAACLIGWPAAHSRSPLIHHYWLRKLGIAGGYNIEAVPPEGFAEFVLHLSTHGFVGANVTIPHKARALADQFGASVDPVSWDATGALLPRAGLLVNTTSLGMHGQPPLEVDVGLLPPHAVVADLVYVPLQTPLLSAARARGLKTADGLGMLLHQAVRGFELWFGHRPEVTSELRDLVEADLTK